MQTKSYIQLQLEAIQVRSQFGKELKTLTEKYNVEDAVFGLSAGHMVELNRGYLVPVATFDTVDEAIRSMSSNSQAIRVNENKFIVGDVYEHLTECDTKEHVFSIEFLEDVY